MKFSKPAWLIFLFALGALWLSACNMGAAAAVPTIDPGAVETQAFAIVLTESAARATQTALAIPPTPIPTQTTFPTPTFIVNPTFPVISGGISTPGAPLPGFTPLVASPVPTIPQQAATLTTQSGCNDGLYIGETRPYDGAQMKPGEEFQKGWTIRNMGTCPWDEGYAFVVNTQWSVGLEELPNPPKIVLKKAEEFVKPGQDQSFVLKLRAPKTLGTYKWCWKLQDDGGTPFGPLVCTIFTVVK